MRRNVLLDEVRMLLALIVAAGHILHANVSNQGAFIGTWVDDILSTGSFSVYCFFGISGFALGLQLQKYKIGAKWFLARYLRLYPMYALSFTFPLIGFITVGNSNPYSLRSFLLYFFGFQAILWEPLFVPQNSPLWTLSIENLLSFSLIAVTKISKLSRFMILLIFLVIGLVLDHMLAQSFFIFYFGFYLSRSSYQPRRAKLWSNLLFILLFVILIFFPKALILDLNSWHNYLFLTALASTLIFAIRITHVREEVTKLSKVSRRSYALFAVHFPVIHLGNQIFFHNSNLSISHWALLVIAIGITTEIAYKFVEVPSIKLARKILVARS